MKAEKHNTFIVAQDAKPLTIEIVSQMFFGKPFNEAVRAICNNKNGEFDHLYASEEKAQAATAGSQPESEVRKIGNRQSGRNCVNTQ